MLARTDDLAIEAAKLLAGRRGQVPVAAAALDAAHEPLRQQAVAWLAAEYEQVRRRPAGTCAGARVALPEGPRGGRARAGREEGPGRVRRAGRRCSARRDGRQAAGEGRSRRSTQLGDPRAADAFLDRIENDPAGTAQVAELLAAAAAFRRPGDRRPAARPRGPEEGVARGRVRRAARPSAGTTSRSTTPRTSGPTARGRRSSTRGTTPSWRSCSTGRIAVGEHGLPRRDLMPRPAWCRGPEVDEPLLRCWPPTPTTTCATRRSRRSAGGSARAAARPSRCCKALRHKRPDDAVPRRRGAGPRPAGPRG